MRRRFLENIRDIAAGEPRSVTTRRLTIRTRSEQRMICADEPWQCVGAFAVSLKPVRYRRYGRAELGEACVNMRRVSSSRRTSPKRFGARRKSRKKLPQALIKLRPPIIRAARESAKARRLLRPALRRLAPYPPNFEGFDAAAARELQDRMRSGTSTPVKLMLQRRTQALNRPKYGQSTCTAFRRGGAILAAAKAHEPKIQRAACSRYVFPPAALPGVS